MIYPVAKAFGIIRNDVSGTQIRAAQTIILAHDRGYNDQPTPCASKLGVWRILVQYYFHFLLDLANPRMDLGE
jgi:hypothetical protein